MNAMLAFNTLFYRTWLKVIRRPVILLLSFVQPLVWMAFFGFLFQRFPLGNLPEGVQYIDFLVPGICAMTVLVGASQSGIGLIRDMQNQFLDRILYSPANNAAMLMGKVSADVLRLMLQAAVVAILGLAIGARFNIDLIGLFYGAIGLTVFAIGYCFLSCWIALMTRKQESMAAFVHLVNMPIFFTTTALVPAKRMPEWLQTIAQWNPLTHVIEPLRDSLIFGNCQFSITSIGSLLMVTVVLGLLTMLEWNRYLRKA